MSRSYPFCQIFSLNLGSKNDEKIEQSLLCPGRRTFWSYFRRLEQLLIFALLFFFLLLNSLGIMPHAEADLSIPWGIVALLLFVTGAYGYWAVTRVMLMVFWSGICAPKYSNTTTRS